VLLSKCQDEFENNQALARKQVRKEGLTQEEIMELDEKEMLARKRYLGSITNMEIEY